MGTTRVSCIIVITLMSLGCHAPQAGPAMIERLGDRLAPAVSSEETASLTVQIGAGASGYRTQFVRVLDWEVAEATLSNADSSIAPQTVTANAAVDSSVQRAATLQFKPVKPMAGYTLSVSLKRRNRAGTYQTLASGANASLTLTTGNNIVNVALSPTSQGHLQTSVTQPLVLAPVPAGNVSTIAGTGSPGSTDGSLSTATFNNPAGLFYMKPGLLYVADMGNHTIRLVDLRRASSDANYVTTVAGTGSFGSTNGAISVAQFNTPTGVWMRSDSAHLLVADSGNNTIRVIDTDLAPTNSNYVRTLAGSTPGSTNGSATSARFNTPTDLCDDGSGHIFVVDSGNHLIRRINTNLAPTDANYVTTWAGSGSNSSTDGVGTAASFSQPYGICIDRDKNLYVSEIGGHRIRKIAPDRTVTTVAGNGSGYVDGNKATAKIQTPRGLTFLQQRLYVSDGSDTIRVIDLTVPESSANYVTTFAGGTTGFADGTTTTAQFNTPRGLAADRYLDLYVGDANNRRVRKIE